LELEENFGFTEIFILGFVPGRLLPGCGTDSWGGNFDANGTGGSANCYI
jgi:hypothetical protein